MAKIIWKRPDGGISYTIPVGNTDPVVLAQKLKSQGAIPQDWQAVAYNIPVPDREFRGAWAWTDNEPVINIDMAKAREIKLNRVREERNRKLAALDIDVMKAVEKGDTAKLQELATEKQHLRDIPANVTPALNACETVDELKELKITV